MGPLEVMDEGLAEVYGRILERSKARAAESLRPEFARKQLAWAKEQVANAPGTAYYWGGFLSRFPGDSTVQKEAGALAASVANGPALAKAEKTLQDFANNHFGDGDTRIDREADPARVKDAEKVAASLEGFPQAELVKRMGDPGPRAVTARRPARIGRPSCLHPARRSWSRWRSLPGRSSRGLRFRLAGHSWNWLVWWYEKQVGRLFVGGHVGFRCRRPRVDQFKRPEDRGGLRVVRRHHRGPEPQWQERRISSGETFRRRSGIHQTTGGDAARAGRTSSATGWIIDFPIATPLYPDVKQYLAGKNAKAVYQAFDKGAFPAEWDTNKRDVKTEFAYEVASAKTLVYVPADYDGTKPYGAYVHISPNDGGEYVEEYGPVMDRHKLIYISALGTSNQQPMLRRIRLAVDAFSSVRAKYKLDPKRVCVGGFSGGGHMGMVTHAMFPDLFIASISHAAQSYLPADNSCGHFPGLSAGDLKNGPLRDHKWCVISGEKDQNYQEIINESKNWERSRYQYRFFNVPGMGHTNAPAASLEEALKWIGL